jgi:hypothetical protein
VSVKIARRARQKEGVFVRWLSLLLVLVGWDIAWYSCSYPVRDLWVCSPRFGKEKGLQKMKRKRKVTHQGRAA